METICPWCGTPVKDGDTHAEPHGVAPDMLTVRCTVAIISPEAQMLIGTISDEDDVK